MGKVKEKMFQLVDLVIEYYIDNKNFDNVDDFIREKDLEFYNFYLYNKNYIIETVIETLKEI
jgi:hypothetical protein